MPRPKGLPKTGGRKKETPNKTTAIAKEAIEEAYAHLQEPAQAEARKDFKSWATDNVGDFYKLLFPKLLPVQMNHGGPEGGQFVVTWQPPSDE